MVQYLLNNVQIYEENIFVICLDIEFFCYRDFQDIDLKQFGKFSGFYYLIGIFWKL